MIPTTKIKWQPFGAKHRNYIKNALKNDMCVAEGAIRSGKTIDHCIIAAAYLETCPDKIHLASGSSMPNAKLNIGDCNGFGLEHLFRGRCRWGKYKDNEALYLDTKTGEKIVIFAGGGKSNSFQKILGNSYGLWIATEINEHYDSEDSRESFIKVAFGRQLAAERPFVLWDLNPNPPEHPIYTNYIDAYKTGYAGGYLYEHFTIDDNRTITPERRAKIESQYTPGTTWYRRDILGERCIAEGLIFPNFADDPKRWIRTERPEDLEFITIAIDYGGNKSKTVFVATGFRWLWSGLVVLKDHKVQGEKGEIDGDRINDEFVAFAREVIDEYPGIPIRFAVGDSAEQYLNAGVHMAVQRAGLGFDVGDSYKAEILDRIHCKSALMSSGRWEVMECCKHVINSTASQVWDPKSKAKDKRLDNGTSDIDTADAEEYTWSPFIEKFEVVRTI